MTVPRFLRSILAASLLAYAAGAHAETEPQGLAVLKVPYASSLAGSYLAGRSADVARDLKAAATYFSAALARDPDNPILLERVLVLRIANGEIEAARELADRLVTIDRLNPLARLLRSVQAFKNGEYELAREEIEETAPAPLAILTSGLMSAWSEQATGKVDEALKTIRELSGPSWYGIFQDYHQALIADLAGRKDEAEERITAAFDADGSALRVVEAYGVILARVGKREEAIVGLRAFVAEQPNHPVIGSLLSALEAGVTPGPIASTPVEGAAEVLYGLGAAIGADQGTELPAAYLHLSHYLKPDSDLTLMALGDLLFGADRCEDALEIYDLVPVGSSLRRNAEIQSGLCLDVLERTDEAAKRLEALIAANPEDLDAIAALGNIYRGRERFAEAAEVYTKGIDTIDQPNATHWRLFYFRGVANERSKNWEQAEADLKKALELSPDQPQVLNYLGYSWVDMGINLEEGLDMIRKAVEQRPNDGYIVDSLGWAYYRLGRYDEAVEQLERAAELRPEDPVINDHLGDAYWQVGRKLEATFQWSHARDLDPEPADLEKIVKKLESGLAANDSGRDG
ncbi:MAG TPA: tetratricopeptide repeat protein [Bauldia sp.]|nr:tetratricopeptide repeat protein [Bauldia sp.]